MAGHKIRIIRSRKPVSSLDYTPQQMAIIGEAGRASMYDRIRLSVDVYDRPAPPLKVPAKYPNGGYPRYKVSKYGGRPIRDWWRTGQTLRAMKVIQAATNRVVIGFTTPAANLRAFLNNRRWRQFGLSPRDLIAVNRARLAVLESRRMVA